MSRDEKLFLAAVAICYLVTLYASVHRNLMTMALALLAALVFLFVCALAFVAIFEWKRIRWRALLPFAMCAAAIISWRSAQPLMDKALFLWALPSYEAIVRDVDSGKIPASARFEIIEGLEKRARLAYSVWTQRDGRGVVRIMFFTEGMSFAGHDGYLYCSSGEPGPKLESRWYVGRKMKEHWYRVGE